MLSLPSSQGFDQPGFKMFRQVEDLLIKSVLGNDASSELTSVTSFYGDDISLGRLSAQLTSLASQLDGKKELNLWDIVTYLRGFSSAWRVFFSDVVTLVKILLVNPATNAISEHSFSAMRRLKTYLRSTMGQSRLNAIMLLHVHKDKTDKLSVVELANIFTSSEYRKTVFGTFSEKDMSVSS